MRNKASKHKTPVMKKTLNPHYNHTFVYNGVRPEDLQHMCLELTVWDREPLASNDFLGGVRLGVGTGECLSHFLTILKASCISYLQYTHPLPYKTFLWHELFSFLWVNIQPILCWVPIMCRLRGRLSSCTVMYTDKCDPDCQEYHHLSTKKSENLPISVTIISIFHAVVMKESSFLAEGNLFPSVLDHTLTFSMTSLLESPLLSDQFHSLCLSARGENRYALVSMRNKKHNLPLTPQLPSNFFKKHCFHFFTSLLVLNPLWSGFCLTTLLNNCSCQKFFFILWEFSAFIDTPLLIPF